MNKLEELITKLKKDLIDVIEQADYYRNRLNFYENETIDIKNTIAELESINGIRILSNVEQS